MALTSYKETHEQIAATNLHVDAAIRALVPVVYEGGEEFIDAQLIQKYADALTALRDIKLMLKEK
jgi:hypothetical protein